jgi:hypothetical protein
MNLLTILRASLSTCFIFIPLAAAQESTNNANAVIFGTCGSPDIVFNESTFAFSAVNASSYPDAGSNTNINFITNAISIGLRTVCNANSLAIQLAINAEQIIPTISGALNQVDYWNNRAFAAGVRSLYFPAHDLGDFRWARGWQVKD